MPAEIRLTENEGIPHIQIQGPKPKGEVVCTFYVDVQLIEVSDDNIVLQDQSNPARLYRFKPTKKQAAQLFPYRYSFIKMEASLYLQPVEQA